MSYYSRWSDAELQERLVLEAGLGDYADRGALVSIAKEVQRRRQQRATIFCPECSEIHRRDEPTCPIANGTLAAVGD